MPLFIRVFFFYILFSYILGALLLPPQSEPLLSIVSSCVRRAIGTLSRNCFHLSLTLASMTLQSWLGLHYCLGKIAEQRTIQEWQLVKLNLLVRLLFVCSESAIFSLATYRHHLTFISTDFSLNEEFKTWCAEFRPSDRYRMPFCQKWMKFWPLKTCWLTLFVILPVVVLSSN